MGTYFSVLRVKIRYELLDGAMKDEETPTTENLVLNFEGQTSQNNIMFGVEGKILQHVRAHGCYHNDLRGQRLHHMGFTVCVIFLAEGAPGTEILPNVDFNAGQEEPVGHSCF